MFRSIAALLAAVSCVAVAQAQEAPALTAVAAPYTLEQAVAAAGGSAPAVQAAQAGVEAAQAGRRVASHRVIAAASLGPRLRRTLLVVES